MPNPAISREEVHTLCEACSDEGDAFQPTASRLVREQRRLSRFFEQNAGPIGAMPAQVALYMLTVSMRVFELMGGRLSKVPGRDIDAAISRIHPLAEELLPGNDGFIERAKAIDWRAQPHLLDEILWALFERDDKKDGEVDVDPDEAALVYLLLWAAVEALDANWLPPADFEGVA